MLKICRTEQDKIAILKCAGTLDLDGAAELKQKINEARADGYFKIIINGREISNINSSVLQNILTPIRVIVSIKGKIVFCELSEPCHKVIKTAMFYPIIKVCDTEEEAIEMIKQS